MDIVTIKQIREWSFREDKKKRVGNKGEQILIDSLIATGTITIRESFLGGHYQKYCSKAHTISNMQLNLQFPPLQKYCFLFCCTIQLRHLKDFFFFDFLYCTFIEWKVYGSIKCVAILNVREVPADLNNTPILYWQVTQEVNLWQISTTTDVKEKKKK